MTSETHEFTEAELRTLLRQLLDSWDLHQGRQAAFESNAHAARVGMIYALAVHTHRLGRAVQSLLDAGFTVEAVPTIRAAFEAAITAAWIQQIPDALPAFLNRNHAQQQALRDTAVKAGWAATRDAEPIHADELDAYAVSKTSKDGAKYTEALCRDMNADAAAYALYRGLSWFTHPTAMVADLYLNLPEGAGVPTLLRTPKDEDGEFMLPWIHIMCSTLVWAARTLNLIDSKRARNGDRQRLRNAAKQLRITEMLTAKPDALERGRKAERARVRSATPD